MTGEEFRNYRLNLQLTQKEVADALGVTWQAVRLWELDDRRVPRTTIKVMRYFKKNPKAIQLFKEM